MPAYKTTTPKVSGAMIETSATAGKPRHRLESLERSTYNIMNISVTSEGTLYNGMNDKRLGKQKSEYG